MSVEHLYDELSQEKPYMEKSERNTIKWIFSTFRIMKETYCTVWC